MANKHYCEVKVGTLKCKNEARWKVPIAGVYKLMCNKHYEAQSNYFKAHSKKITKQERKPRMK